MNRVTIAERSYDGFQGFLHPGSDYRTVKILNLCRHDYSMISLDRDTYVVVCAALDTFAHLSRYQMYITIETLLYTSSFFF